jgi:hypothetical protein
MILRKCNSRKVSRHLLYRPRPSGGVPLAWCHVPSRVWKQLRAQPGPSEIRPSVAFGVEPHVSGCRHRTLPRAKAWREAQLSLLHSNEFKNPFFWAAFTMTGQWR